MTFRFQSPEDHAAALRFFHGHEAAHHLFHDLLRRMEPVGPFGLTATKSRVALTARTRFLWCHEANDDGAIWIGFLLPHRVESPRLRSGLAGGRWSHHTKIRNAADLDAELLAWLREAYAWDVQGIREKAAKPRRPREARSGKTAGRQTE